ncbi:MAG: hypothetical protein OXC44_06755 [Proteobacteria bacterium]|nr:hypothetical protein [Pseudomonadota bacterium]
MIRLKIISLGVSLLLLLAVVSCSEDDAGAKSQGVQSESVQSESVQSADKKSLSHLSLSQDQLQSQLDKKYAVFGMTTRVFPLEKAEQKEDSINFVGMVVLYSALHSFFLKQETQYTNYTNVVPGVLKQVKSFNNSEFGFRLFDKDVVKELVEKGEYNKEDILLIASSLVEILKMIQSRLAGSLRDVEKDLLGYYITPLDMLYKTIEAGKNLINEEYKVLAKLHSASETLEKLINEQSAGRIFGGPEVFFAMLIMTTGVMATGALLAAATVSGSSSEDQINQVLNDADADTHIITRTRGTEEILQKSYSLPDGGYGTFGIPALFVNILETVDDRMKDVLTVGEKRFIQQVIGQYESCSATMHHTTREHGCLLQSSD